MSHDDLVSEAMKQANPVPPGDPGDEPRMSLDKMLAHVKAPAKPSPHVDSTDIIPVWHRRGPTIALGTFVLVIILGVGSALLFRPGPGTLTTPIEEAPIITPIETVQSMFDAWNRGDVEAYLALQSDAFVGSTARIILENGEDNQQPSSEEAEALIRDDFTYWFLIGTEWELNECSTRPAPSGQGDQVNCQLTANSVFERAYGVPNDPKPVRFTVEQGFIVAGTADRIGRGAYTTGGADFFSWVRESIDAGTLEASSVPCLTTALYVARQGRVPSGECSQWIADHLPQWIATLKP
ncbi:MAG: hypothetical protein V3S26_06665, partial [Acidimicrobiia bacterium]